MAGRLRFLLEPERSGPFNMARDFYFLKQLDENPELPGIFTVYSFKKPCLSLGKFQKSDDEIVFSSKRCGFDVVRRPTGGRAVLHGPFEKTYSLILSVEYGFKPRKIRETYNSLMPIFDNFLMQFGIKTSDSKISKKDLNTTLKNICFLEIHRSDVSVNGKKAFGNALLWLRNAFLIHGSIYLRFDEVLFKDIFGYEAAQIFKSQTFFLEDTLKEKTNDKAIVDAFLRSLQMFGFEIERTTIAPEEEAEIKKLEHIFSI
ncbi:MAG: hypothetical protein N2440_02495 [Actinobacteria bacterium]|nr:hypothetical protein [Actinomycetota bacterium]